MRWIDSLKETTALSLQDPNRAVNDGTFQSNSCNSDVTWLHITDTSSSVSHFLQMLGKTIEILQPECGAIWSSESWLIELQSSIMDGWMDGCSLAGWMVVWVQQHLEGYIFYYSLALALVWSCGELGMWARNGIHTILNRIAVIL